MKKGITIKNKLMPIGAVAVALAVMIGCSSTETVSPTQTLPTPGQQAKASPKAPGGALVPDNPIIPSPIVTSDPFTPPPEYMKKEEQAAVKPDTANRSPVNVPKVPVIPGANRGVKQPVVKEKVVPSLAAVVVSGDDRLALLQSDERTAQVRVGQVFAGYKVTQIGSDSVTLEDKGKYRTITVGK